MVRKKSELYSSPWQSCDELRGGIDASQYKDYVLVPLFLNYAGVRYVPITIPDIGDQINKKIIRALTNVNKLSNMPDFNNSRKCHREWQEQGPVLRPVEISRFMGATSSASAKRGLLLTRSLTTEHALAF